MPKFPEFPESWRDRRAVQKLEAEDVKTINDGSFDVPYIAMEPISVTKDNMNEVIIGSDFHLKEDVYLNVPELMP